MIHAHVVAAKNINNVAAGKTSICLLSSLIPFNAMGILYLSVELSLDLITCIMGVILMFRAHDNGPKFWWGCIALVIGAVFAWENIGWLTIVSETPEYRFTDLLNLEKILKWFPVASAVALFPLASLYPGYLTTRRTLICLSPSLLFTMVGVCYLLADGYLTHLQKPADICHYIGNPDVQLRCVLFLLSVIIPLLFFFYPAFSRRKFRQINFMMYVFWAFMLVFLCIYIFFTLDISYLVFNLFGATAIVFTFFFSLQYLRRENPFTIYAPASVQTAPPVVMCVPQPLFYKIDSYFHDVPKHMTEHYTLTQLAGYLHEPESLLSEAIKSAGYSSYREYAVALRLEYFRRAALLYPDKNIKELIFLSGFRSRATFYRNFADKYGVSPLHFLEEERKKLRL